MGKFKVGDRVRFKGNEDGKGAGKLATVHEVCSSNWLHVKVDAPFDGWGENGLDWGVSIANLEPAPKFAVGDRVRGTPWDKEMEGVIRHVDSGTVNSYLVEFSGWGEGHSGSVSGKSYDRNNCWWFNEEDLKAPATLTIRAGRYYKTRDGRKVGPMEAVEEGFTTKERIDGIKRLWQGDGTHGATYVDNFADIDLIAEWADEPVVATTCVPKFKVGDRVENAFPGNDYDMLGTVTDVTTKHLRVRWDGTCGDLPDDDLNWRESELRLITPATTAQCIVALIENGQPKPAARPFVHPDRDAAAREARRLAGRHKGQEFGVYELVGTEREAKVYEHAWQWLAASGETCHARRELQRTGITGIQASRIVQEFVAAA